MPMARTGRKSTSRRCRNNPSSSASALKHPRKARIMSVVDQLKNLFSKKSDVSSSQNSGELSLAMPDHMVDPIATSSIGPTSSNNAISMGPAGPDSLDDESTRLEEPGDG